LIVIMVEVIKHMWLIVWIATFEFNSLCKIWSSSGSTPLGLGSPSSGKVYAEPPLETQAGLPCWSDAALGGFYMLSIYLFSLIVSINPRSMSASLSTHSECDYLTFASITKAACSRQLV
jgi:hypothetical protein